MEKKKILITGFPHTGTTILRSKFGECYDTHEVLTECDIIHPRIISDSGNKKNILIKSPVLPLEIRKHGVECEMYKDFYIIFTNRNPWNLFTSIIKRGYDPLCGCRDHFKSEYYHTIEEYIVACKRFLEASNSSNKNLFTIKYEDFFEDDGINLKNIMNSIGLEFDEDIFRKKTKDYKIDYRAHIPSEKPSNPKQNEELRNWQINQPFQNMNSEVDIPEELNKILSESPIIKELGYTDPRIK